MNHNFRALYMCQAGDRHPPLSATYVSHCIDSQGFTVITHSVEGFGFPAEDAQGRRAAEPEKPLRRQHWPDKGKAGGVQLCKKEFYP